MLGENRGDKGRNRLISRSAPALQQTKMPPKRQCTGNRVSRQQLGLPPRFPGGAKLRFRSPAITGTARTAEESTHQFFSPAPSIEGGGHVFCWGRGTRKGKAGPCTASLGPYFFENRIGLRKGKGRETGRRKATDLRSPSSDQEWERWATD